MFKYLKEIFVHYNYVDRNFLINFDSADSEGDKPFRHLIITGKNGSGKTKVLEALNREIHYIINKTPKQQDYFRLRKKNPNKTYIPDFDCPYPKVELEFYGDYKQATKSDDFIYAYLNTYRYFQTNLEANGGFIESLNIQKEILKEKIDKISEIDFKILDAAKDKVKQEDITNRLRSNKDESIDELINGIVEKRTKEFSLYDNKIKDLGEQFGLFNPVVNISKYFLQYLFEKKNQQAFAISDEETEKAQALTQWFKDLNKQFKFIFENNDIELKHKRISSTERKFYFELPNGRTFDFNQLSHGYNNIFAIVAEIWLHIEAYQTKHPNDHNPRGLVIIDELETHLHLSLQEKILPFLTGLFPNIQFVIATHSPVIMASEANCVIYDLDGKYTEKDNITGTPYDVLMTSHLGLSSEYSLAVTKDLNEAKELLSIKKRNAEQEKKLRALSNKLSDLSPTLALDIILALENYAEAK